MPQTQDWKYSPVLDGLGVTPKDGRQACCILLQDPQGEKRIGVGIRSPGLLDKQQAMRFAAELAEVAGRVSTDEGGARFVHPLAAPPAPPNRLARRRRIALDRKAPTLELDGLERETGGPCWCCALIDDPKTKKQRVGVGVRLPGVLTRPQAMDFSIRVAQLALRLPSSDEL